MLPKTCRCYSQTNTHTHTLKKNKQYINCLRRRLEMMPQPKPFGFKPRPNGEVLKCYQRESLGSSNTKDFAPFVQACFDADNQRCATIDTRSRMCIFNVQRMEYTKLLLPSNIQQATTICFHMHIPSAVLVGTEAGEVVIINAETGHILQEAKIVSTRPIHQFVWPANDRLLILTKHDIHLVHSATFERIQKRVNLEQYDFQQLLFSSADNIIYGITNRKAFVAWPASGDAPTVAFDAVRLKYDFLRTNSVTSIGASAASAHPVTNDFDDTVRHVDVRPGDGRQMCVCSDDGILIVRHLRAATSSSSGGWQAQQFVQLSVSIKHLRCSFVPTDTADTPQLLLVVTTASATCLVDVTRSLCQPMLTVDQPIAARNLIAPVSPSGDWIAIVAPHCPRGEFRLFSVASILAAFAEQRTTLAALADRQIADQLQRDLGHILTPARLERQLTETHEYPRKYRHLIWHYVLRLPRHRLAFERLQRLGAHPCTANYATTYPLADRTAGRHLVRIVSALAHWCPALGALAWLPRFVFPFLRVYPHDPLAAFETIATLLLNHGQLWLEFSAVVPPHNYLALCERLLAHFVPRLHAFYAASDVTATLYVGSLLEAAFTEVLDEAQWMRLWDHVCTRPAWWLPFALVAFNKLMWRGVGTASAASGRAECEQRFGEHASQVDMGRLAELADRWAAECPAGLHPRQYLEEFRALAVEGNAGDSDEDGYRKFTNFPRFVEDWYRAEGAVKPRDISRLVNERLLDMEQLKGALVEWAAESGRHAEHDRRLFEAEKLYADTMQMLESIALTKL